jgi:hypothetical protein
MPKLTKIRSPERETLTDAASFGRPCTGDFVLWSNLATGHYAVND